MRKRIVGLIVLALVTICVFGCGSKEPTQAEASKEAPKEAENEIPAEPVKEPEAAPSEKSLSYAGTYYHGGLEEYDDQILYYIDWLVLNEDGTGVYVGQDSINLTWEDGKLFYEGGAEETFECDGFSLTKENDYPGTAFRKTNQKMPDSLLPDAKDYGDIERNTILPLPTRELTDPIEDGIYGAKFEASQIVTKDGKVELTTDLFDEYLYDTVDLNTMKPGDILYVPSSSHVTDEVILVDTISHDGVLINVNGGVENYGASFGTSDDMGGTYYFQNWDIYHTYKNLGTVTVVIPEKCEIIDNTDLDHPNQRVALKDFAEYVKTHTIGAANASIMFENNAVENITVEFVP